MAKQDKVSMPQSGGGLVRYFEGSASKVHLKPGHVIILIGVFVILWGILELWGRQILGLA